MSTRLLGPVATGLLAILACPAIAAVGVTPTSTTVTLEPGESADVTKTVTVPSYTPKLDLLLIVDLSGSYRNDLPNIKSVAPSLFDAIRADVPDSQFGLATFRDFPFYPWGGSTDYAYRLNQDLTTTKATWTGAINAMGASGGADGPESQYEALWQAITGAGNDINGDGDTLDTGEIAAGLSASFRDDATKVIAITTDAPFHNSTDTRPVGYGAPTTYPGAASSDVLTELADLGFKVIAIKAPGATTQMDALADATGGAVVSTTSTSSNIASAILSGLEAITYDVSATPGDACDPLDITFDPASHSDVPADGSVEFTETIAVPGDIIEEDLNSDGQIVCEVEFLAESTVIGVQTVTVNVPLNEPPVAVCTDLTLSADGVCQAYGSIDDGSFDPDEGDEITIDISPEGPYELGDTVVTLTVTDTADETDSCTATVTVVDDTPPTVSVTGAGELWPPDHKYWSYTLADCGVTIEDNCSVGLTPDTDGEITSIYSDELEDGSGDGKTLDDIVLEGAVGFWLRAERRGGHNGRVYGVSFDVTDDASNDASATCLAFVPHDQSGDGAIDDGAGAGYVVVPD